MNLTAKVALCLSLVALTQASGSFGLYGNRPHRSSTRPRGVLAGGTFQNKPARYYDDDYRAFEKLGNRHRDLGGKGGYLGLGRGGYKDLVGRVGLRGIYDLLNKHGVLHILKDAGLKGSYGDYYNGVLGNRRDEYYENDHNIFKRLGYRFGNLLGRGGYLGLGKGSYGNLVKRVGLRGIYNLLSEYGVLHILQGSGLRGSYGGDNHGKHYNHKDGDYHRGRGIQLGLDGVLGGQRKHQRNSFLGQKLHGGRRGHDGSRYDLQRGLRGGLFNRNLVGKKYY